MRQEWGRRMLTIIMRVSRKGWGENFLIHKVALLKFYVVEEKVCFWGFMPGFFKRLSINSYGRWLLDQLISVNFE